MAKSKSNYKKRKTRSDKFPLTLHKTGQFCKKIKGKLYYFGTDKKIALERYFEQAACLHTGKGTRPSFANDNLSLITVYNWIFKSHSTASYQGMEGSVSAQGSFLFTAL